VTAADPPPNTPCPHITAGYQPCGLLWQHPGPCVPFVPGEYLPPPMLHPVDFSTALGSRWYMRCPLCRRPTTGWNASTGTVFRGDSVNWDRPSAEWEFTFEPCGCVGRVIVEG